MLEPRWGAPVCYWNNSSRNNGFGWPTEDASNGEYVSSSLQDDLEMSDSDDEVVPEVNTKPEENSKSVNEGTADNNTLTSTENKMEVNSADSSSSESGDSDSDDSSSESNDSDSSSDASDEEISSKKWGLSNFVDESQRIHSPAFFQPDAAAKESFRLHAERIKNFGLGNVNLLNGTSASIIPAAETSTFLVPEVPVTTKGEILSPIPSPVRVTVGPRTPPTPSGPLKQASPDPKSDGVDGVSATVEIRKEEDNSQTPIQNNSQKIDASQENCDKYKEKGTVQNEKCKKQIRSGKGKAEDFSSEVKPSVTDSLVNEPCDLKNLPESILEKDNSAQVSDDAVSDPVIPENSESLSENYSIKTRQRGSAASSTKKNKSCLSNSSENSQNVDGTSSPAIAMHKHPRACRKANEKQTKKNITNSVPIKTTSPNDTKKPEKQEAKEIACTYEISKDSVKSSGVTKSISKTPARLKNKTSKIKVAKVPSKPRSEVKKTEGKKKKKFAIENFLQSPENESARAPNALPPFTPSPERSPIPECQNTSSKTVDEPKVLPSVPSKTPSRPKAKNSTSKKVGKLRRSVRCSERASNNAPPDSLSTSQPSSENKKNSKSGSKAKRQIAADSLVSPVDVLSPSPHTSAVSAHISDSAIPVKIMVCIPLSKISRLPTLTQGTPESAVKAPAKSSSTAGDIKMPKKDSGGKSTKNLTVERSQAKDLKDKVKTVPHKKNSKSNDKSVLSVKKEKISKPLGETSTKPKVTSDTKKISVKVKDKAISDDVENKLPKKRKSEAGEKLSVKKAKLSTRTTEEKKSKETSVLKTDSTANRIEGTNKPKALERCDSTGSLSSLCSQQSQRSSKSSKERKKDTSTAAPESKRIKTSSLPLIPAKDIKQEKEDVTESLDVRIQVDKNKSKLPYKDKQPAKESSGPDQCYDASFNSSQYCHWEEKCKEDPKVKILGSSQNLADTIKKDLAGWDHFVPEMHKELKEATALNKISNLAPMMPMDYYRNEGRKQIKLADKEKDPFHQSVKYFEAGVLFILTSQQKEEVSKDPDSIYEYYTETLKFSGYIHSKVQKLQSCPGSTEFKLLILCLKCESLLNVKLYNLKIKEIKEQLDGVTDFLQHQCSTPNALKQMNQERAANVSNTPTPPAPSAANGSSQGNTYNTDMTLRNPHLSVNVPQSILDLIYRQHTHLINLHNGHDLWEQADMYMTRSNLREFFKEVADQSEPLTLHSSITELVKYIQKGLSLVKKSLR